MAAHPRQRSTRTPLRRTHLAGPLALRRITPERYTLTPRLDTLPDQQRTAIHDTARVRGHLDEPAALVLLTALAHTAAASDTPDLAPPKPGSTQSAC
jgi:hypothetical protein